MTTPRVKPGAVTLLALLKYTAYYMLDHGEYGWKVV